MKPETLTLAVQLLELFALIGGIVILMRRLSGHPERREVVNQPLLVKEDAEPVTREEWRESIDAMNARIEGLIERVDTLNASFRSDLRQDIERVHERIDGMPDRIVALLRNTGVIKQ